MKGAPPCEVAVKRSMRAAGAGVAQAIPSSRVCGTVSLRCENVC